jgi:hypothetical protein
MPKTAVGLFENAGSVEAAVREIETLGFPRSEVRTIEEPVSFGVSGVMSFPRLDFEVALLRELARIGASETELLAYRDGLRRGGALVVATGEGDKVYAAADVMQRHGAIDIEERTGPEPQFPFPFREEAMPQRADSVLTGRIRQAAGGLFVW